MVDRDQRANYIPHSQEHKNRERLPEDKKGRVQTFVDLHQGKKSLYSIESIFELFDKAELTLEKIN